MNIFPVINKYGKGAIVQIGTVYGPVYRVACGRALWKRVFQTIIESPFSKCVVSEISRLWGSSVFGKCSEFNVDFRYQEKNWDKVFSFWDNSIWIGCVVLSLICREYLSSAVSVLINSHKIFHSTKGVFFQLNYVHSDQ